MPATFFFLTIKANSVVVEYDNTRGGRVSRPVASLNDLRQFLISKADEAKVSVGDLTLMASSSLDFPEEYTSNKDAIALAHQIH